MSKDGDWVLQESAQACAHVLDVLAACRATYRPSPPLDVRWLAGGWSSHFEFFDERRRRVRCDFVSRPPRVSARAITDFFSRGVPREGPLVVDVESLILMKQTQRAKDYPVLAPLASLLPAEREIELTTDPDRLLAMAPHHGASSTRPSVLAARSGERRAVVTALAEEADELQRADARRVAIYAAAAAPYLEACRELKVADTPLREAHERLCELATRFLPERPLDSRC